MPLPFHPYSLPDTGLCRLEGGLKVTEARIIEQLLGFIAADDAGEAAFNRLALDLFAYQFENNTPYRRFATGRAKTVRTVRGWRDIPTVPISAFKDLTLSCRPPEEAVRVFMTSGTTKSGVRGHEVFEKKKYY